MRVSPRQADFYVLRAILCSGRYRPRIIVVEYQVIPPFPELMSPLFPV